MKVLLIEPPFHRFMYFYRHYYPLGLAYIAATLLSHDHVVEIYDAEHDAKTRSKSYLETSQDYSKYLNAIGHRQHPVWSEIEQKIIEFQPDLVGISVLTVKVPSALRIASISRTALERVPNVVGGEHPTARPEDLLKDENVGFAIRGEGEQTMCELVDALENDTALEKVEGLSFKSEGRICHNKNRALIKNLDCLPIPARNSLANKETYRPVDFGLIMGSRGCSYRCAFCPNQNIWGSKIRFRSVSCVIDEIKSVQETYSTHYFSFRDYSFSINREWTIEFCKMVRREKLDIQWECTTRIDLMDEDIVFRMKDAGCTTIRVGIESGSERILKEIRKDLSLREVREKARILNRHNIYWAAYFMFGLPSETEEDIEETLALIDEIDPPFVTMARFTPQPGSEIYENLVREGRITEGEVDWSEWGNQWLRKSFTRTMSPERFQEIMKEVTRHIDEHNRRTKGDHHPLLKME